MNAIISQHLKEIVELCQKFGVVRLDAFGSIVRDDFDQEHSDIDLIASFTRKNELGYADRYLDFAESLEMVLGRKVDLITPASIRSVRLAQEIRRQSVSIYASQSDQAA